MWVVRQTASPWKTLRDAVGIDALQAMPPSGGTAYRLDAQSSQALGRALLDKPAGHGFGTALWALMRLSGRIGRIGRLYGIQFGNTQIWRILSALGFSVKRPGVTAG